MDPDFR